MATPSDQRLLTDAELELMAVLWEHGECSVRDVLVALDGDRAYTTVSTLLRIMDDKGFVTSRAEGRRHLYAPAVERSAYQARNLDKVVHSLFGGSPSALVRRLVCSKRLSADEVEQLRRLLDEVED